MSVQVATETRFMEHFSVGTGVNPGWEILSATNRNGDVEVFTIGRDGLVHNYFPDPTSNTGYSTTSLGSAQAIGVITNSDGNITVFLSFNLELHMVVQQPGAAQRWSSPQPLNYPRPPDGGSISEIYPTLVESAIYIALRIPMDGGVSRLVIGCLDGNAEPTFNLSRDKYPVTNYVWFGATRKTLRLALVHTSITTLTPDTLTEVQLPFKSNFTVQSAVAVADDLYSVLDDGNVYRLDFINDVYSWTSLTEEQSLYRIYGVVTNTSTTHLLLISANADLWHMAKDPSLQSEFSAPLPIGANAYTLSVSLNGDGQIDMFAGMPGSVTRIFFQQGSGDWQITPLNVPIESGVETYSSYGSDVSFQDELGTPLALTGVTIWTAEPTVLQIGGAVYSVGPDRKARVTTNALGVLNVQQPTTGLSVPPLLMHLPDRMAPDEVVTNAQDAIVQQSLAVLTGQELLNATTAGGAKVLQSQYRTEKSADAIAQAVTVSMQLVSHVAACAPAASVTIPRARPGLGTALSTDLPALRKLTWTSADAVPSWRFHVGDDGQPSFELLTAEQAATEMTALRRTIHGDDGFWDFIGDLGDLIAGAAQGLLDIVQTVVNTVSDGVHVAISFVVDGVQHLFETVVKTVEQAFDLVESVFSQVKVSFNTLFQWLGYILDRGDISRTARAVAYLANQFLDFMGGAAAGLQRKCDDTLQALVGQMETALDTAIQVIGPNSTPGGYARSHQPDTPQVSLAQSNNVLLNHFIDRASSRQGGSLVLSAGPGSLLGWDDIVAQLTQIATDIKDDPGFAGVAQFFSAMGQSADNLFRSVLATLLTAVKALAKAILSGVQAAIDLVFKKLRDLLIWAKELLNAEWNIPVLSAIFSHLFPGLPLTILNLVAAIVAIPTTALYKILQKGAPFPDDGAVANFEQSVSAANMLAASGLGSETDKVADGATSEAQLLPLSGGLQEFLGTVAIPLTIVSGALCAIVDIVPKVDGLDEFETPFTFFAVLADSIAAAALIPWFFDGVTHWDVVPWVLWAIGLIIDWIFIGLEWKSDKVRLPEFVEPITQSIYGILQFIVTAIHSRKAEEFLSAAPRMYQVLRTELVAEGTEGVSLFVLAGIDSVCAGAVSGILFWETWLDE